jgi:dolichyl-phosphate beta-glucosyltransferase
VRHRRGIGGRADILVCRRPMNGPPQLSIIIPAFNEERRIAQTLDAVHGAMPSLAPTWEIRVVDDGSSDDTAGRVEAFSTRDRRVVLQREPHRGKGAAVRAGMLASSGDVRFMCDADLSMPLTELPRFLAAVPSRADIAIGSREGTSAKRIDEPPYRHYMGRLFNAIVQASAVPGIEDTQCGFKLFSADAAHRVFSRATIDGWAFDVEALTIALRNGLRILEIPIEWRYGELSRVAVVGDSLRMVRDVCRVRMNAAAGRYDVP